MTPAPGSGSPTGRGAAHLTAGERSQAPADRRRTEAPGTVAPGPAELDCSTYYEYLAAHTDSLPLVPEAAAEPAEPRPEPAERPRCSRRRRLTTACLIVAALVGLLIAAWALGSSLLEPSDGLKPADESRTESHAVSPASGARAPAPDVPVREAPAP